MTLGETLRYRKYDWLPFFSYPLFFITLYYAMNQKYEYALISSFAVTLVCLSITWICKLKENQTSIIITLSSNLNSTQVGQKVTFVAQVESTSSDQIPTGFVTFYKDSIMLDKVSLIGGQAQSSWTASAEGPYKIKASYGGDDNFDKGTSVTLKQVVSTQAINAPNASNIHAPFVIFSAVFGIIAAFAITEILSAVIANDAAITPNFSDTHSLGDLVKFLWHEQVILVISFFPIGILFYHCGIVFLSTEAAELIAISRKKTTVFFSSLILFLEGIVLLLVSHSSSSLSQFSLWIFILMALDISWVLFNLRAGFAPLFQWLHFDGAMLFFALTIILLPEYKMDNTGSQIANVIWYVLIVFTVRTFYDYHSGWKFWTKFLTPNT